jgi:hypothetical protein
MAKKRDKGINPDLEDAISQLLKSVMSDPMASLEQIKLKYWIVSLKLEAIKLKMKDDEWGASLLDGDDDDEQKD